jgi:putative DNA primase/helicase
MGELLIREGQHLRLTVNLNGRARSAVIVEHREHGTVLIDTLNLVQEDVRRNTFERCAEGISDPVVLEELADLLNGVAQDVALKTRPTSTPRESQPSWGISDPEPWPGPVSGDDLAAEMVQTFERFAVLPPGAAVALSLWTLHTHAFEVATISPLLLILSPTMRAGKSTVLRILHALVKRPVLTSSISSAALYRFVEESQPCLLADEADTWLNAREELRGLLDAGHTRDGAYVIRCVGDQHEARRFSVWAPKVLCLIGKPAPTLVDRAIVIPMRRKLSTERVERFRIDLTPDSLEPLKRRAARWALDNHDVLLEQDPHVPESLDDRSQDNWRGLLGIADTLGGDWLAQARQAINALEGSVEDSEELGVQLLGAIQRIFDSRDEDRLFSSEMVEELNGLEGVPWPDWRGGKGLSMNRLARFLKSFEIKPRSVRKGTESRKGYLRSQFVDAFGRYLTVTGSQRSPGAENSASASVTPSPDVTVENPENAPPNGQCDPVTVAAEGLASTEDLERALDYVAGAGDQL